MVDKIISIQSKLVYGYVGSNIADLAIQLHGLDTISFPTVFLSLHTGHQPVYGETISKKLFDDLVTGIESFDMLDGVACIISGYIKTEEIIKSASAFIKRHPDKTYICDPVMGDHEGLFVPEETAKLIIEHLIPISHIITPNHFELEYILGKKIDSVEVLVESVRNHPVLSTKTVIVTSSNLSNIPKGEIENVIINSEGVERIRSKRVDLDTTGTGDLFASIVASQLTLGNDVYTSVKKAKDYISNILNYVHENNLKEMNAASLLKYIK